LTQNWRRINNRPAEQPEKEQEQGMKTKKCTEYLKYQFTEEETRENAKKLARKNQELAELDLKKKQIAADIKAETDAANADAARLARWVNDEYDFRMIDCEVMLNSPGEGQKTTYRVDTGEVVKTEKMTADEMQQALAFV
jgi:hypothetical protein